LLHEKNFKDGFWIELIHIISNYTATKRQLISEGVFGNLNSPKKRTKNLQNFALATRAKVFGRIEVS
jgi:hypothetical protein